MSHALHMPFVSVSNILCVVELPVCSFLASSCSCMILARCCAQDLGLDPIVANLELERVNPHLRQLAQATQGSFFAVSWADINRFVQSIKYYVVCACPFASKVLAACMIWALDGEQQAQFHPSLSWEVACGWKDMSTAHLQNVRAAPTDFTFRRPLSLPPRLADGKHLCVSASMLMVCVPPASFSFDLQFACCSNFFLP